MTLVEALLAALVKITPADPKEAPDALEERQQTIAITLADEAAVPRRGWPKQLLVATMFETWRRESGGFDPLVHAGERHPRWHSDHGRARCLGQLHASPLVPDWEQTAGTDIEATARCARGTARVLHAKMNACRPGGIRSERDLAVVLTAYAVGRCDEPTVDAKIRAVRSFALARQLRAALRCPQAQPEQYAEAR